MRRRYAVSLYWLLLALFSSAWAETYYVDYANGKEQGVAGTKEQPFASYRQVLSRLKAGDTVYILPAGKAVFDSIHIKNLHGTAAQPIVIDGMMNVFTGARTLSPEEWLETSPGLFLRKKKTASSMVRRYFMWMEGKPVRMGQKSKFASEQKLKKPDELSPFEWTIQNDEEYYLRLPVGKSIQDYSLREPVIVSGLALSGSTSHIVFRNFIVREFWNDGLNLHHQAKNIVFENTVALFCGDDGASSHEECEITIRNFISIGNATGICHVGNAVTRHENVYITGNDSREVYLLSKENHLQHVYVNGTAPGPFSIKGSKNTKVSGTLQNCLFYNRIPGNKAIFEPALECRSVHLAGYDTDGLPEGISLADRPIEKELETARQKIFAIFAGRIERELAAP